MSHWIHNRTAGALGRKLPLAVLSALVLVAVSSYAVFAASTKADFSLSVSPSSQTLTQGASTSYASTMTPSNGFSGQVTLSVSGLPTGATGSLSANPVSPNTKTCPTCQNSTLTVNTAPTTPTGTYTVTVTGTSGSGSSMLQHATTVTLVVNANTSSTPSFSLTASPSSLTVAAGTAATYTVSVGRTSFTSGVTLSATGLPSGAAVSFSPNPVAGPSGSSSTMTVTTNRATTPAGTYALTISGSGGSPTQIHSTTVTLVVSTPSGRPFPISGSLDGVLYPGASPLPLNLSVTNPNNFDLSITNLTVTVASVTKAPYAPAGTCSASDFAVQQFSGAYPFKVNSGLTISLSSLGFPQAQFPQVRMIDQPYAQDGCKNATINFAYSGTAVKANT
jgi:hypothetical protein